MPSGRWQATYQDPRTGTRHAAPTTFASDRDAGRWLDRIRTDLDRGGVANPIEGRKPFTVWAQSWLDTRTNARPRTIEDYESILNLHVIPRFGRMKVCDIRKSHAKAYIADLTRSGKAPGTVRAIFRVFYGVLEHAREDEALVANPAAGLKDSLPTSRHEEMHFLDAAQVELLADAITRPTIRKGEYPQYGLLVRFAAYSGLRASEIAGLRCGHLNLTRGTVRVTETTQATRAGLLERQRTKTERSERTITVPRFLVDDLAAHLGDRAADRDALVFPAASGGPHRHSSWYHAHYQPAARQAGMPDGLRFHDLRHTCASLLIDQGHHPRAIMEYLGHSDISVTMNRYGHLYQATMTAMATSLDNVRAAAVAKPIKDADVRVLPTPRPDLEAVAQAT